MALDPQVAAFLEKLAADPRPGWDTMPATEARRLFEEFNQFTVPPEKLDSVEDLRISSEVSVRIFRPTPMTSDSPAPVVVYFHGGGWVLGNLNTHDSTCRRLAKRSGCCVVSVEYRLAPEFPFPAAVDDAFEALSFVVRSGAEQGFDPDRIAVAGDSAGGNLAAAVACRAGHSRLTRLRGQLLIYPATSPRCDTQSFAEFADGFGLTAESMNWFWKQYLQGANDHSNPLASFEHVDRLELFPKTLVLTAEYDVLRDEGEAFAKRLGEAGVDCELRRYDGLIHGFFHFTGLFDRGLRAVDESAEWLRDLLQP